MVLDPVPSEVRLVGAGERRDVVAEEEVVVGFADVLDQRAAIDPPPMLDRRPRHVEGARIVDRDGYLQRLAAVGHLEALDDVNLVGVRRAVIVDERPVIEPDGIDDQLVAFVVTDGFAVPRRRHLLRMRHVQIDVPYLGIELVDDDDHLGRLDEMNGLAAVIDIEAGNACRPASLSRDERDLSAAHVLIGLAHPLDDPRLQNRIGEVRDPIGRLALAIGNIRVGLVRQDRARPAGRRQEVVALGTV